MEYVVFGEEQGLIKEFKTIKEAQKFIKELKKEDKRENIQDRYYIEEIDWEEE